MPADVTATIIYDPPVWVCGPAIHHRRKQCSGAGQYSRARGLGQWRGRWPFLVMSGEGDEMPRITKGWGCPFCLALILYFWLITSSACGWNIHLTQQEPIKSIDMNIKNKRIQNRQQKRIAFKTPGDDPPRQIPGGARPPAPPPPGIAAYGLGANSPLGHSSLTQTAIF